MRRPVGDSVAPRPWPGEVGGGAVTAATGPALVASAAAACVLLWWIDPSGRVSEGWSPWTAGAAAVITVAAAHPRARARTAGHALASVSATAFAALAMVVSGEAGAAVAPMFVPIAVYSAYVLPRRPAVAAMALIAGALGGAVVVADVAAPIVLWLVTVLTTTSSAYVVRVLRRRLRRLVACLDDAARIDALTGLLNRRAFDERLAVELGRARRSRGALTVVVADLDRLKEMNDRHGHEAGDRALRLAASALAAEARESDAVARIGGDEFAAVLADTDHAGARRYADRVRGRLRRARPSTAAPTELSIGAATFPQDGRAVTELLRVADAALYRRKRDRASVA
jgi:diguanylate cyclase (GGDEF)-like protein